MSLTGAYHVEDLIINGYVSIMGSETNLLLVISAADGKDTSPKHLAYDQSIVSSQQDMIAFLAHQIKYKMDH